MPHLSTISNYQIILDQTKKLVFTIEKSWKSLFGLNNKKKSAKNNYKKMGH